MTQEQFEDERALENERELWLEAVIEGDFEGNFDAWLENEAGLAERRDEDRIWRAGCGPRP